MYLHKTVIFEQGKLAWQHRVPRSGQNGAGSFFCSKPIFVPLKAYHGMPMGLKIRPIFHCTIDHRARASNFLKFKAKLNIPRYQIIHFDNYNVENRHHQ